MKLQYVSDDGKKFGTREEVGEYEESLKPKMPPAKELWGKFFRLKGGTDVGVVAQTGPHEFQFISSLGSQPNRWSDTPNELFSNYYTFDKFEEVPAHEVLRSVNPPNLDDEPLAAGQEFSFAGVNGFEAVDRLVLEKRASYWALKRPEANHFWHTSTDLNGLFNLKALGFDRSHFKRIK